MYEQSFYKQIEKGSLHSAQVLVSILFTKYHPKSVVDLGCGTGTWLKVWGDKGTEIFGVEGEWVKDETLLIPQNKVLKFDLSKKLILQKKFDLAMSLEVAEHLPASSAEVFVQSLIELADRVVFSAAIPGQGGRNHINEQWPGYWADLFAKYGFGVDDYIRYQIWGDENIEWWYRQNILVFEKGRPYAKPISLVHPGRLSQKQKELGLRQLIKKIIKLLIIPKAKSK